MSRRDERRRGNIASLAKTHQHPCSEPGCYEQGLACYDSATSLRPDHWYCLEHRSARGYCYECGVKGEGERFTSGPEGKGCCDICWEKMWPADGGFADDELWPDDDDWWNDV